jgi:hypothetical protein
MANCGQRSDGSTPTLTTTNLQNSGKCTNYQVQYDNTITSSTAQASIETLRANLDADFNWMQQLFNGASSPWSGQMQVNVLSGPNASGSGTGACWPNLSGPITLYPGVPANNLTATIDPWFLRYLVISEVVEMFMSSTGSNWYGGNWSSGGNEGSAGEALSRFLGAEFLIQKNGATGGEPGYDVAKKWMNSPRTDFVNGVNASDNSIDPTIGCATVFVYYLFTQLGIPITVMTANGAKELSGVYANVTGDENDPFPFFKNLVDIGFPGTATITSGNLDNPWPIAPMSFVGVKSSLGLDEATDIVHTQGGLVSGAFTLWIEGLSKAAFLNLNISVTAFTGSFTTLQGVTIQPNPIGAQFENGVSQFAPQRIQIPFDLHLTSAFLSNPFPPIGSTQSYDLSVSLNAGTSPVTASQATTQIELVSGADPYFTNLNANDSNYAYLSQDLRVFTVTPAVSASPIPGVGALGDSVNGAYSYIQAVLKHFNDPMIGFSNPSGPDPFTTVLPDQGDADQADSSVYPFTIAPSPTFPFFTVANNYNFAIARVRLRGSSGVAGEAANVRVFFRLFATQNSDTDYDPTGTYAFTADPSGKPGSPLVGAGNTTFPFFATANFAAQTDYTTGGINNQTIVIPDNQDSVWVYYGCFLNVYDPNNKFSNQQIQALLSGTHHCLVAQIAFDDAPIPVGVSPLAWDQLAQRNLQVTTSDNPGPASTHRVPQTFDCRPSKGYAALQGALTVYPDELMIDWGRVPTGSVASLYWPQVSAADVVQLARQFYGATPLTAVDAHTVKIPITGGLSYIPIPSGSGQNFAGLFTIDLPPSVQSGESYDITVKRVGTKGAPVPPPPPPAPRGPQTQGRTAASRTTPAKIGKNAKTTHATQSAPLEAEAEPVQVVTQAARLFRWRYVIGTFQVHIPVSTAERILPSEETTLAIMKWRLQQMGTANRWYPVLLRYIAYLSGRVNGLGGDAASIPPSLTYVPPALTATGAQQEITGKICEVLFDCHGDFQGFILETCCGAREFRSHASRIGELALKACREELTVKVQTSCKDRHMITGMAIRR